MKLQRKIFLGDYLLVARLLCVQVLSVLQSLDFVLLERRVLQVNYLDTPGMSRPMSGG